MSTGRSAEAIQCVGALCDAGTRAPPANAGPAGRRLPRSPRPGNPVVVISTSLGTSRSSYSKTRRPSRWRTSSTTRRKASIQGPSSTASSAASSSRAAATPPTMAEKADPSADPERGDQRPEQPAAAPSRWPAPQSAAQRDLAVLHQPRRTTRRSTISGFSPRRLRLRRVRPRARRAWTSWIASRRDDHARVGRHGGRAGRPGADHRRQGRPLTVGARRDPPAARHLPHDPRQPDRLRDHHPAAAVLRRRRSARRRSSSGCCSPRSRSPARRGARARRLVGPLGPAADPDLQPARHRRQLRDAGARAQPGDAVRRAHRRRPVGRQHHHGARLHRRHHAPRRTARKSFGLLGAAFGLGFIVGPGARRRCSRTSATPRRSGPRRPSPSSRRCSRGCGCRRPCTACTPSPGRRGARCAS